MKLIITWKFDIEESNENVQKTLHEEIGSEYSFILIRPKDNSYKIEEIRNFLSKLNSKQSDFTKSLFYIFLEGDSLTPVCQNALLKTLEESSYSIGIIVHNKDSLLPTIRSRMQEVQIKLPILTDKSDPKVKIQKTGEFELDIAKLSKEERAKVIQFLENKIDSLDENSIQKAIPIQEAIRKLQANCKVEAVITELSCKM